VVDRERSIVKRLVRASSLVLIGVLGSLVAAGGYRQVGLAVYYPGRPDAQTRMTAAHRTLPKGTWVTVTHRRTGRTVRVKINDRGPWDSRARIIDLSRYAAARLGILSEGVAPVTLELNR
jgi:rare lipoprotein A